MISNFLTLFDSLKVVLINIVTILMMWANIAIPGYLKLKEFRKKG